MVFHRLMFALFVVVFGFSHALHAAPITTSQSQDIAQFVQDFMKSHPSAGASVAIQFGDDTWSKGFGTRDFKTKKPATPNTSYRMASVTKSFTATLILRLVELGKISLDDEIQKYVPYFPRKKYPVTVRALLGHLSGIPHYVNCRVECHIKEPYSTRRSIKLFERYALRQKPGDDYLYTSYGYNLLGAAAERVTRLSFGKALERYVFKPAGMSSSLMDKSGASFSEKAAGYRVVRGALVPSEVIDISSRFAGGGTRSTVLDMVRFGDALMAGKLVKPETFRKMADSMSTNAGVLSDYGMGFGTYPQNGRWVAQHSGGQPETTTMLSLYPGDELTVAVAVNVEGQSHFVHEVTDKIVSVLLANESVRRRPRGRKKRTDVLADAFYKVASHGVARARFFGYAPKSAGESIRAMQSLNEIVESLSDEDEDIRALAARVDKGDDPMEDSVFPRAGTLMASMIQYRFGKERLAHYDDAPFLMPLDFEKACRDFNCPSALRLRPKTLAAAARLNAAYQKSKNALVRVYDPPLNASLNEIQKKLGDAFTDAEVVPDLSKELAAISLRALKGKRKKEGHALAQYAHKMFAESKRAQLAYARSMSIRGDEKAVYLALQKAKELDFRPLPKVTKSLRFFTLGLKRDFGPEAARVFASAHNRVFPKDAEGWDLRSTLESALGDITAAREATQSALAITPTQRRKKRLKKLRP